MVLEASQDKEGEEFSLHPHVFREHSAGFAGQAAEVGEAR